MNPVDHPMGDIRASGGHRDQEMEFLPKGIRHEPRKRRRINLLLKEETNRP